MEGHQHRIKHTLFQFAVKAVSYLSPAEPVILHFRARHFFRLAKRDFWIFEAFDQDDLLSPALRPPSIGFFN